MKLKLIVGGIGGGGGSNGKEDGLVGRLADWLHFKVHHEHSQRDDQVHIGWRWCTCYLLSVVEERNKATRIKRKPRKRRVEESLFVVVVSVGEYASRICIRELTRCCW